MSDLSWDDAGVLRCVLCFVVTGGRVLLIRKLRGLGAGKINGPGGKIEAGETPEAAALRETEEEIGARPTGLREAGRLWFRFADGLRIHVVVFRADGLEGAPRVTAEAIPQWAAVAEVPYGEMWADDVFWLPLLFERRRFEGRFLFDGDRMVEQEVKVLPERSATG